VTAAGRVAALALGCAAAGACGLFPDLADLGGGDATSDVTPVDASDAASSEAGVEAGSDALPEAGPKCQGTAGPPMVAIDGFCIDSTEVTNAEYQAFVGATAIDAAAFPPTCVAWKTTLNPQKAPPPGSNDYPVVWIDWCDAYAYCAWAGKRLCGRIDGGALAPGGMNDVAQDEWYVACSNVGANVYPYGAVWDAGACNGPERDAGSVLPASSMPGCVGGGIYDMVGNADEWIDSCLSASTGPEGGLDKCERRSGSWEDPDGSLQNCTFARIGSRNEEDLDIGFRCCSDLAP